MKIKITKPYLIAETACSHNGSVKVLKNIIKNAVNSGFSCIQLQIWKHQNILTPNHKDYKLIKKIEISFEQWSKIINFTRNLSNKIDIIACVYDTESLDFCLKNKIKYFKIHSADLSNKAFITSVARNAKRIDLSIGGSSEIEIKYALKWIGKKCQVWLMYGLQLFPTNPRSIDLNFLKKISRKYKVQAGYQDHTYFDESGHVVPGIAIFSGVNIIEKHVTDYNHLKRIDGESAIEISKYKKFVENCNLAFFLRNRKINNKFSSDDLKYRKYSKKIIIYKKNIIKGSTLKMDDIIFLRSKDKGVFINQAHNFIGKKIKKDVKKFTPLLPDHI